MYLEKKLVLTDILVKVALLLSTQNNQFEFFGLLTQRPQILLGNPKDKLNNFKKFGRHLIKCKYCDVKKIKNRSRIVTNIK